ncbi:MAG: DUF3644 domain-containing protein [Chloroflexi bacterium]|nr:DUF3644 domain-containing protein [Chloroflexota bacterium]MCY3939288.1 DUF3644 domain-containing protein [Chloroflexota bacterium]
MTENCEEPDLKCRLVKKSFEAYVLALETINRITIQYRIEAFCYLICNAWELLLKAKILEDEGNLESIYYLNKKDRKPRRSLSLRDCLNRVMPNRKDPVRRNIERIEELRDEAVHLVLSQIPRDIMGLFQAGVINYHNSLNGWFEVSLTDRVPAGMMSIVYDMRPEQSDPSDARLRREMGRESAEFLSRYCLEVRQEFDQLQRPAEFSIGIDYHLVLTKRPDEADIVLSSGQTGRSPTQIVEVPKDPARSHPFRETEVLRELKSSIRESGANQYDVRCVNKVYRIKKRSDFFYQGKIPNSPGQYSQSFVNWIIQQYQRDDRFFVRTRAESRRLQEEGN